MSLSGNFIKHHHRLLQLLQACSRIRSLDSIKPLHGLSITMGPNPTQPAFLHNNIIYFYASIDELPMSCKVFDNMPHRNVVSYNSMIGVLVGCDDLEEAWRTFRGMMDCGLRPNEYTLATLLSCASMRFGHGVLLLALAIKGGMYSSGAYVGTAFLGLAGRCGLLDDAFWVFRDMPRRSLVTWNSMISLLGQVGFVEDCVALFRELLRTDASLSEGSFIGVLSGLVSKKDLILGEQVHGLMTKSGFCSVASVMNSLISAYSKCASLGNVNKLFDEIAFRDVVTWNTIIGALARSEEPVKAIVLFSRMSKSGIMPSHATYASIINSCASLLILMCGEFVHAKAVMGGFETDVYVGSSLVDYYTKCNKLNDAHRCFSRISQKNVISWNALILGYADKCSPVSMYLLQEMLQVGCQPNEFSFSAILRSSTALELQQLHCLIMRLGYESNEYVLSSLIKCYGRNGRMEDALAFVTVIQTPLATVPSNSIASILNRSGQYLETLKLLSELDEPDIVSWNVVIAACARNSNCQEAIELFKHMMMAKICPDNYTFVSLLSVCCKLCDLSLGTSVHGLLVKTNFGICDSFVYNVLIDMYGKCGVPCNSLKIFDDVKDKNLITWTALISALGINGLAHDALAKFREMELMGFIPDEVTFTAVLAACRHGALVREGVEIFEKMSTYGIEPEVDHYHCIVDLLARHGHVDQAEVVLHNIPFPPTGQMWRSFLQGCKSQKTSSDRFAVN